jgi:hypothetical protein
VAGTNRRDILSNNPYEELRAGDTLGEVEEMMEGPESEKGAGYGRYTQGMGRLGLPKQYSYTLGIVWLVHKEALECPQHPHNSFGFLHRVK